MAFVDRIDIALELSGDESVVWHGDDERHHAAISYLQRQARCIGGGTTEMARNVISERILDMPREFAADRDRAFSDVKRHG